jgi:hypothetical protein
MWRNALKGITFEQLLESRVAYKTVEPLIFSTKGLTQFYGVPYFVVPHLNLTLRHHL